MKLTRWLAQAGTLATLLFPVALLAQMAKPIASYDLKASLDVKTHSIHGSETLVWWNDSPDIVETLRFHLYMNAFKNQKSTFHREAGTQFHGGQGTQDWGWIDVKSMRLEDGRELASSIRFIHPDDANGDDQTVIEAQLPEPVQPGATLNLRIDFETKLPEIVARTGYHGTFYLVGQWFPKIGVWETAGFRHASLGAWNCHQFHANSEFFANFGNYRAELTVHSEYKIGATGELQSTRKNIEHKTITWTYQQDSVTDFAWTAQPTYLKLERTFVANRDTRPEEIAKSMRLFNISKEEAQLSDVKITLLLQPEHAEQAERHFRSAIAGIKGFGLRYGHYPYKTLTLVDPPYGAGAASGMEYPTFITCGTSWRLPEDMLGLEEVTVHEFGHQFWMQLVATNEFEESWLDEGFNTYSTTKIVAENFGTSALPFRFFGLQMASLFDLPKYSGDAENRVVYQLLPDSDPILRNAWSYADSLSYGVNSYMKTAVFLLTLERLMGPETMARVMRTYHLRYRFHHPDSYDFLKVVNEVSARDFTPLFDQFVFHARRLDYKVDDVQSRRIGTWTGVFDEGGKRRTVTNQQAVQIEEKASKSKSHKDLYETTVRIRREGDAALPVDLWIHFDDGTLEKRQWDGVDRWAKFTINKTARADWVQLDPYKRNVLDVNWTNDSWKRQYPVPLAVKWGGQLTFWMQNVALWLSALV